MQGKSLPTSTAVAGVYGFYLRLKGQGHGVGLCSLVSAGFL